MIKFENYSVMGWEHAIRGMRNPKNSWGRIDSAFCKDRIDCRDCSMNDHNGHCLASDINTEFIVGPNDHKLAMNLRNAGTDHRKFMRMITVYVDITAPLYWWKEFDTYKVGTVANSCSTMHTIHEKEFTLEDFSHDHLFPGAKETLCHIIDRLNYWRKYYISVKEQKVPGSAEKAKSIWYQMIQLLPTSYNQKRTIMFNYEVLANMYKSRKNHKLDEWHALCRWIETLPYAELITGKEGESDGN